MNKAELVRAMAVESGLTVKASEEALNAFITTVEQAMVEDDKVSLMGFGTFEVRETAARKGTNFHTKETIEIPASKRVKFKVSKVLKDAING